MYHHVSQSPGLVTVSPQTFRAHMRYLAQNGFHSITCDELTDFLAGKPLPKKSVLISFDDGFLDNYIYAHPILQEFNLHAVLFLITGQIGEGSVREISQHKSCLSHKECKAQIAQGNADKVMLRWSEIKLMQQKNTFEFHSHTHTHTRFDQTISDQKTRDEALLSDLLSSRESLKNQLKTSDHLCWPQGFYDENYIRIAQSAGFNYLYTTEKGVAAPKTANLKIPRIVAKDKSAFWLASRLWLYGSPFIGQAYLRLRGK